MLTERQVVVNGQVGHIKHVFGFARKVQDTMQLSLCVSTNGHVLPAKFTQSGKFLAVKHVFYQELPRTLKKTHLRRSSEPIELVFM